MESNGRNLNQRLHEAEILLDISRKVAAKETLDDVLRTLVEITTTEVGAERGSLFLNDARTNELYSRVLQGQYQREIRILNNTGIAGLVFSKGKGVIIDDAYKNEHFNRSVDEHTGFKTKNILCAPIKTVKGDIIGVAQVLNKKKGVFTDGDLSLLAAMTSQAAIALQTAQLIENVDATRKQELKFLELVSDITGEIDINKLLQKVMGEATRMLNAERSTLFLNDEKTNQLWSMVGQGLKAVNIRFPNHLGIAGNVFTTGQTIKIDYAYADLRFNPSFDKQTGYFTRSILCVPVVNKKGKTIGVTQVLNKKGGLFTGEDESRLKAFTAQVSVALENAKLFNDVQNMKNYNEGMLESMSNGVITLDEDGKIATCNRAARQIMQTRPEDILKVKAENYFVGKNDWIVQKIERVEQTHNPEIIMDAELKFKEDIFSVNVTILPLMSVEDKKLGTMIMIEDISSEKRMKSTMSRYMDPDIAEQLMSGGEDVLGGRSTKASILFSDVRSFTTLTEELGAQGTVSLLNEYFTLMVDCIQHEGGMLDKFIGDAIMAAFGIPLAHEDDEDRAVRSAISMITSLQGFNKSRAAKGLKQIDIGIGINTDSVVSGNIGSPKRMDYTVIGDGVNLAARLESACKQYSARILVSEYTVKNLRGTYRLRDIDHVVVKGKTEPVGVYEVLDYHTKESFPNIMEVLSHFKEGREYYRVGKWDKAIAAFNQAFQLNPKDKLSQTYIDRCHQLRENPPRDWKGIWVMKSK
jgi:adenylate cyclase